eukprot:SAG11_NODE_1002_length_6214_cov_2.976124_6_plen_167_part_00
MREFSCRMLRVSFFLIALTISRLFVETFADDSAAEAQMSQTVEALDMLDDFIQNSNDGTGMGFTLYRSPIRLSLVSSIAGSFLIPGFYLIMSIVDPPDNAEHWEKDETTGAFVFNAGKCGDYLQSGCSLSKDEILGGANFCCCALTYAEAAILDYNHTSSLAHQGV